ncbi:peptidase domain-containing ABC transporter [Massilia antarctica]|uniref:peptidase domain-containing ABC transporter n=1 Tax=Massilia antarctica TaxID=2765360 RepID=UPI0006BB69B5|nr:peptidase domain-containing ABC transporter [Massilia sp. H27-R4]MCY0915233.1 peptidase domain-containing ABC transporter [Massilia sp. H27-R4]CUI05712.1 toxin secretion ABC transporter, ATP-binding subunit/permease protein, putative [Janthinobacterium sp. CG23_2]CUU29498.1 toxin secretion ABC transporter, ATP-binding subunit/permease protein, putative [Janthinobacterium sp. CG23_2]
MNHKHPGLRFWDRPQVPTLLQIEAAECGLACLAMVASYWGHEIDLPNMRRRFSVSIKGTTLNSIISMAQRLNLQPRPVKLTLPLLAQLKLPAVLHWNMNHFVVLKSVHPGHVIINDPAVGERKLPMSEVDKHFTGIALELTPSQQFEKASEKQGLSLSSLLGRSRGIGKELAQLLTLGIALQVCALVAPFYLQWVIDEVLVAQDRELLTVLGIGFLMLVALQVSIGAVRSWITSLLATNLKFQWLGDTFAHLQRLPLPWFEKRQLGDIVSRFNSIENVQRTLTTQFVEGVIDGLLVVATLIVMLMYSLPLAAVSMLAVAIYFMIRWIFFRTLRNATAEQIIHAARQNTIFIESTRGIQSIRLFGKEDERRIFWLNALADQFNAELRIARVSISFQTANTLLFTLERGIVIWMAALAVMDGAFSVGMLFAFLSYKDQFSQRIAALIDKIFEMRMLGLHAERIADIVLTEPEQRGDVPEVDAAAVEPAIEVRNLAFRYSDSEPHIFKNLNLTIPAGQCVAITGPSGCGKTTLLKVMLGLFEPTQGEIFIDEVGLARFGRSNYRQLIGTVMQEDRLFVGSIADNICFFDPTPDLEHAHSCAKLAAMHAEIVAMPMAYDTILGDAGFGLSGGQKQRILLARALYRRPKLLVLDEATSHLDISNEKAVNAAIQNIAMTRILVAHRPETIAMADRIIVLEKGKIVSDVTHAHAAPAPCAEAMEMPC